MGYNMYDNRNSNQPILSIRNRLPKQIRICTHIHTNGNTDMGNDLSDDVKDRLQLNQKSKGQPKGNHIDMVCKLVNTAI